MEDTEYTAMSKHIEAERAKMLEENLDYTKTQRTKPTKPKTPLSKDDKFLGWLT